MSEPPALRVERALQLVPEIEALTPLRALLLSTAKPPRVSSDAGAGRYLTVGKRYVEMSTLREQLPGMLARVSQHVSALCEAVVEALEYEKDGDYSGAVRSLLRAGEREQQVGRWAQAQAWYELALGMGEELRDREPEIGVLLHLGWLCSVTGRYRDGARWFQRGLALAEAEFQTDTAIVACRGLGRMAELQGSWTGADSWYRRALATAEHVASQFRIGQVRHDLGVLASKRGDAAAAAEQLRAAVVIFETLQDADGMTRVLLSRARLELDLGRLDAARHSCLQALDWAERREDPESAAVAVRIMLAEVLIGEERMHEAEDELRRSEDAAIRLNLSRKLAEVYVLLGRLRGLQGEEEGFVFFEKAIELCRGPEPMPLMEGRVYSEYGAFRRRLGESAEAHAYLRHAYNILSRLGNIPELKPVLAELAELPVETLVERRGD